MLESLLLRPSPVYVKLMSLSAQHTAALSHAAVENGHDQQMRNPVETLQSRLPMVAAVLPDRLSGIQIPQPRNMIRRGCK